MATSARGGTGPERAYARPLPSSGTVRLDEAETAHLVRVRRARVGDEVVLFDGLGASRRARLESVEGAATLRVLSDYPDREPRRVVLAVALPAAGRTDDLVASLAEMGVSSLLPLSARRSAVDVVDLVARRRERWDRLAREAAKVNGRSRTLVVEEPIEAGGAPDWARSWGLSPVWLHTDPTVPRLSTALPATADPLLIVGPEGGFDEEEGEVFRQSGVPAASLGACVLRTETAATAAAAVALAR